MLHNDFQLTDWKKLDCFFADTEYTPFLKYNTKEFDICFMLSAFAITEVHHWFG